MLELETGGQTVDLVGVVEPARAAPETADEDGRVGAEEETVDAGGGASGMPAEAPGSGAQRREESDDAEDEIVLEACVPRADILPFTTVV